MEFPKMLYLDGDVTALNVIVESPDEETVAIEEGYAAPKTPNPDDALKADLQRQLTTHGVDYDKRWGVDKLQVALDGLK